MHFKRLGSSPRARKASCASRSRPGAVASGATERRGRRPGAFVPCESCAHVDGGKRRWRRPGRFVQSEWRAHVDGGKRWGGAHLQRTLGQVHKALKAGSFIRVASFSPDSRLVATASRDGFARLWSLETGGHAPYIPPRTRGHESRFLTRRAVPCYCECRRDCTRVGCRQREPTAESEPPAGGSHRIVQSRRPACPHLQTATLRGSLRWRLARGWLPWRLIWRHNRGCVRVPDGSLVVTADGDGLRPAVGYERQAPDHPCRPLRGCARRRIQPGQRETARYVEPGYDRPRVERPG